MIYKFVAPLALGKSGGGSPLFHGTANGDGKSGEISFAPSGA